MTIAASVAVEVDLDEVTDAVPIIGGEIDDLDETGRDEPEAGGFGGRAELVADQSGGFPNDDGRCREIVVAFLEELGAGLMVGGVGIGGVEPDTAVNDQHDSGRAGSGLVAELRAREFVAELVDRVGLTVTGRAASEERFEQPIPVLYRGAGREGAGEFLNDHGLSHPASTRCSGDTGGGLLRQFDHHGHHRECRTGPSVGNARQGFSARPRQR